MKLAASSLSGLQGRSCGLQERFELNADLQERNEIFGWSTRALFSLVAGLKEHHMRSLSDF